MQVPNDIVSSLVSQNHELHRQIQILKERVKAKESLVDENEKLVTANKELVCDNSRLTKRIADLEMEVGGESATEAAIKEMMKPENRAGVGPYLGRVNHIALIVSDVGRSVKFYSEILGLPQINRPNFDRHGAWFTCGNVELHLIKGKPVVHDGTNLIVAHISIESDDIASVHRKLLELGVPFEQNVSVPSTQVDDGGLEQKSRVVSEDSEKMAMGAVTQYFFRDPDGYYFELCNCEILTEFCFAKNPFQMNYVEGVLNPLKVLVRGAQALQEWRSLVTGEEVSTPQIFDMFDRDESGNIFARDLIEQLKDFGQTELKNLEEFEDKMIGQNTFREYLHDKSNFAAELRAVFKLMDKDNSGFLTAAQLRHVMTQYKVHLSDDEVDEMIAKVDRDGDGQVNIEEFVVLLDEGNDHEETIGSPSFSRVSKVDLEIFENLKRRKGIYGDIMQCVENDDELKQLLIKFRNSAPPLINYLEEKYKNKRVLLPPAYLLDDGTRFQPKAISIMHMISQSLHALDVNEKEDSNEDGVLNIDSPRSSNDSVILQ